MSSSSSSPAAAVATARVSQLLNHLTAAGSNASGAKNPSGVTIISRTNGVAVIQIDNPPVGTQEKTLKTEMEKI